MTVTVTVTAERDLLESMGARTDRLIPGSTSASGLAVTWAETAAGGTLRRADTATLEAITAYTVAVGKGPIKKALTVKQPWAWAIVRGLKDVENRSRPTKHRGTLYIHAGKGWSQEGANALNSLRTPMGFEEFPLREYVEPAEATAGMVIGTVDVIDCHHADECAAANKSCAWGMGGHYHWVLANARPLACPFPETGKLGLWTLGAPSATASDLKAA